MTRNKSIPQNVPGTHGRSTPREHGLDWLRVFAFGVLIFFHSGMAFVGWDWHIKNTEKSHVLDVVQWNWGVWPKVAVTMAGTFLGSWIVFEAVRRTWLTRLLFGLKERPERRHEARSSDARVPIDRS